MTVLAFPGRPQADIAKDAREFADSIDAGEHDRIDAAIVITTGKALQCLYWGEGIDMVQAIGVLEVAKANLVLKLMS